MAERIVSGKSGRDARTNIRCWNSPTDVDRLTSTQESRLTRQTGSGGVVGSEAAMIDAYIGAAPSSAREALRRIREIVRAAAPKAEETLSYGMPALRGHGVLLYFAAFRNHIGLFPPVRGDAALDEALAPFRGPKGNLRFPLDAPIPHGLIERIARLRAEQDRAEASAPKRRRHRPA